MDRVGSKPTPLTDTASGGVRTYTNAKEDKTAAATIVRRVTREGRGNILDLVATSSVLWPWV